MSPARAAALLAGGYGLLAGTYIVLSSFAAGETSRSVEELRRIEILKGLGFVLVTSLLLFAANLGLLQRMRKREELERRMERALSNAERTVLVGTFARTIAHDINNALASALLTLPMLRERVEQDAEARESLDVIDASMQRVADWNRRFFEIGGRRLVAAAAEFDLGLSVGAALDLARHHRTMRHARLEFEQTRYPGFHGVDSVIQRAVLNLILNAADASGESAHIRVSVTQAQEWYVLTVDDNGPGVPPELRAVILEPFYTSKPNGTGLGLASVVACARLHHGSVSVEVSPLGGARFVVMLKPFVASELLPAELHEQAEVRRES